MEGLLEKMVTLQEESEKHFMQLQEKLVETERERQKESQDFMLRMMGLMCQPSPGSQLPYQPLYPPYTYNSMCNGSFSKE